MMNISLCFIELSSVFHYNDWCISLNNKRFRVFSDVFVLAGISLLIQILGILTLLFSIVTLRILKRHILAPNEVF